VAKRLIPILGGALGGLAIGVLLGITLGADHAPGGARAVAPGAQEAEPSDSESTGRGKQPRGEHRRRRQNESTPADGESESRDLGIRPDEVEFVRDALAVERERRAAETVPASASGMELLRREFDLRADVSESLWDYESSAARVRTGSGAEHRFVSTGDVTDVSTADLPAGVSVFSFGPGTFRVKLRSIDTALRGDMKELEIRGAGMDRTFLDIVDIRELTVTRNLENLSIRDLTFDSRKMLLDIRGHTAMVMENVRINGWATAGHDAAIGVSGQAFVAARNCIFDAGPGRGRIAFSDRGASLSVFDNCTFIDVHDVIRAGRWDAAAGAARLIDCTYVRSQLSGRELRTDVRVRGGTVRLAPLPGSTAACEKAFGAHYAAAVEGVTYEATEPQSSVAQVLSALRAVRDLPGRRAIRIRFDFIETDGSRLYTIHVVEKGHERTMGVRTRPNGAAEITTTGAAERENTDDHEGHLSLLQLLEGAGLSRSDALSEASFAEGSVNGEVRTTVNVRVGGRLHILDARSGKDLFTPR